MLVAQNMMQVKFTMTLDLQMIWYQFGSFVTILSPTYIPHGQGDRMFATKGLKFLVLKNTFCSATTPKCSVAKYLWLAPSHITSTFYDSFPSSTIFTRKHHSRTSAYSGNFGLTFWSINNSRLAFLKNIQEINAKSLQLITSLTETQSHLKQVHFTPNCLHSRHTSQDQRLWSLSDKKSSQPYTS